MVRYDHDGTPIRLALRPSDICPQCHNKRKTLMIRDIATIVCLACGSKFNRWVRTTGKKRKVNKK